MNGAKIGGADDVVEHADGPSPARSDRSRADTAAPMPQIQPGDVVRLASGEGQSIGVMEALLLNGLASKEHIDMIERPYGTQFWRRGSRTP